MLAKNVGLAAPITAVKIVDAILFILLLVWFIASVLGIAR